MDHDASADCWKVYYEDVPVGYWTTVKFSGALPAKRVNELLERVEKLHSRFSIHHRTPDRSGMDETSSGLIHPLERAGVRTRVVPRVREPDTVPEPHHPFVDSSGVRP